MKWYLVRIFIFMGIELALVTSASTVVAQVPYFNQHDLDQKFPGIHVNVIYQDPVGFIWFGTNQGLIRFTGIEYQPYIRSNRPKTSSVTALYYDDKDRLWTGYDDGSLSYFNNGRFTAFEPPEGLPKAAITGIIQGENGILWFSTYGEGLYYYNNERLYNINVDDGLPDNTIYCIVKDKKGQIWAGTDGGIGICSVKNNVKIVKSLTTDNGLPDNIVKSLALDEYNNLWIGMHDAGVAKYDIEDNHFSSITDPVNWKYGPVKVISVFDNEAWVGTKGNGVIIINRDQNFLAGPLKYQPLLNAQVLDILGDAEGNIWIATQYNSVYSTSRRFSFFTNIEDKKLENLHSILSISNGNLWFSDSKGLYEYNFKTQVLTKKLETNEDRFVISLYQDINENIWAGTFGNGLYFFEAKTSKLRHFTEDDGLINNSVLSIKCDGPHVWFATLGGLSRTELSDPDKLTFTNYDSNEGLGTNYIYQIITDKKGNVWFATDGKGLALYRNDSFIVLDQTNAQEIKSVYSMAEDSRGMIWFSVPSKGLFRLASDSIMHIGLSHGLGDLDITGIIPTSNQNFLLLRKSGIDVLNINSMSFQHYESQAGIGKINPDINAFTKDKFGNIWIATQQGLIRYHPLNVKIWPQPKTIIDNMLVYLKPQEKKQAKLQYDQNYISFEFNALWYQNPERVSFQYRLEGYNYDWIITQDRIVSYPNLPPGSYNFQIRSSVNGNFTNSPVASYNFIIRSPFWIQWWFYLLAAMATMAIIILVIKMRERHLQKQQKLEKENISFQFETLRSQVNPHFLFNSFNTLISIIEENRDIAIEYVEHLADFFRNILQYRDKEIIPLEEEIKLTKTYYYLQKKRYGANLELTINVNPQYLNKYIPPLTLQLLVENAVKHNVISRAKPLKVEIISTSYNQLTIKNTLQKKLNNDASTGTGLENIRNRYTMLTKEKVLINESNNSFSVTIPLL